MPVILIQVYNRVFVRWTTHSPPGLSHKDIAMARFCDEQAVALGEIRSTPPETRAEGQARAGEDAGEKITPDPTHLEHVLDGAHFDRDECCGTAKK